jgi:hypothetical protein
MRLGWLALVAGCGEGSGAADEIEDSGGLVTLTTGRPCVVLVGGRWEAAGEAFEVSNTADLATEGVGCSFVLSDWARRPDGPDGGVVFGDQVTLDGNALWKSCIGTATPVGTSVSFTCDRGDFTLTRTGP